MSLPLTHPLPKDADEFAEFAVDARGAPAAAAAVDAAASTPAPTLAPPKPPALSPLEAFLSKDHTLTLALLGCAGVYVLLHLIGAARNAAVGKSVLAQVAPFLTAQFAAPGVEGVTPGPAGWSVWASGRRHVHGALVELALAPRQEPLSAVVGWAFPALAGDDVLTLEVPLSTAPGGGSGEDDGFVLAAYPTAQESAARGVSESAPATSLPEIAARLLSPPRLEDVDAYCVKTLERAGPGGVKLSVACEHSDTWEGVAGGGGGWGGGGGGGAALRVLHITNAAAKAGYGTATLSAHTLKLALVLPRGGGGGAPLAGWLAALPGLIDGLAGTPLSKHAREAVGKARQKTRAEAEKAALAKAAEAKAVKDAALKAEEAAAKAAAHDKLPRSVRKEIEAKERAAMLAEAMKPRRQLVKA